jgi:hypothetical protein
MNRILLLLATIATLATSLCSAQSQTIVYQWLNVPCSNNIHCNTGCSACNIPESSSPAFFGTNMIWPGVDLCPHPVSPQDNALYTTGWPIFAEAGSYGLLSGLSTMPMQVDSIIIRHRSDATGPQRLKIFFTTDVSQPSEEVGDLDIAMDWNDAVLTNLGRMEIPQGNAFGTFQIKVQAYQGNGGSWQLDEIRVVASPVVETATGITEIAQRYSAMDGQYVDLLGRSAGTDPAPGFYIGKQRVVRIP